MLVIGLIVAVLMYAILALLWVTAGSHLSASVGILEALNKMLFVPDNTVLIILRGLILVTFLYLITDFLISGARRGLKRRAGKAPPSEVKKKWVKERAADEPIAPD
jgi:uncharacterized metal-binding protein